MVMEIALQLPLSQCSCCDAEVLAVVTMKITVFWHVVLYSCRSSYQCSGGMLPLFPELLYLEQGSIFLC
jgi:hypothetical protein